MTKGIELAWTNTARTVNDDVIDWQLFSHSRILITGSTGLVGAQLVRTFLMADQNYNLGLRLILPVRNIQKAEKLFFQNPDYKSGCKLIPWDLKEKLPVSIGFDYAIHAASPTQSSFFVEYPVQVIDSIIMSSKEILERARSCSAKKVIFVSSMEVYGRVDSLAEEEWLGSFDSMNPRNSYPESKRLVECLCASYAKEYGLDVSVARLAQTFGAGVSRTDSRVFAQFARSVQMGTDIELYTDGSKANPYISLDDAVCGLIVLLQKGAKGCAYNIANDETYCSVLEMAQFVVEFFGFEGQSVLVNVDPKKAGQYPMSSQLRMSSERLKFLGWRPKENLMDMYKDLLASWS